MCVLPANKKRHINELRLFAIIIDLSSKIFYYIICLIDYCNIDKEKILMIMR